METKTNKLNARDFIFIGIFAAVALLIFFIRAEALIPPMLCVVIKGIKADCNHLIEHTVRNVEHCAPMPCVGVVDYGSTRCINAFRHDSQYPDYAVFCIDSIYAGGIKGKKNGRLFYYGDNYRFTGIYGSKRNRRRPFNYRLVHCGDSCVNDEVQR